MFIKYHSDLLQHSGYRELYQNWKGHTDISYTRYLTEMCGLSYEHNNKVIFKSEQEYMLFLLKWS